MNMIAAARITADILGCPHTECDKPVLCSERCMRLVDAHKAIGELLDVVDGPHGEEANTHEQSADTNA